jgi:hypothetical protein
LSTSAPVLRLPKLNLEGFEAVSAVAQQMEKTFAPFRQYAEALSKAGQGLASKLKQIDALLVRLREAVAVKAKALSRRLWASISRKAKLPPVTKLRLALGIVGRLLVESPPIPKPLSVLSTHSASNAPNACYRKRPRSVSRDHRLEVGSKLEVK